MLLINYRNEENAKTKQQKEAEEWRKKFRKNGLESLHILDKNISNTRYPGFSQFHSPNSLQNSSYCYTIPRDIRIKDKGFKKLNDNIYNIPDNKSNRYTILGFGQRINNFGSKENFPSPHNYIINSLFDYNLKHNKGSTILGKSLEPSSRRFQPGVGAYNLIKAAKFGIIPITIKSRQGFYYDDDLRKKKHTVSMQKYSPRYHLVEINRFKGAGIGIGERMSFSKNRNPGPADYTIPGNFDRGLKGKLALN